MRSLAMLLGAAATYVACAMPVDTHPVITSSPGDDIAPAGSGGTAQPPQGPAGRTFVDAMSNPVPQAEAQALPVPPDIAVTACVKLVVPVGDAGSYTLWVAEHLYPGKKMVELSAVRAIVHYTPGSGALFPAGYEDSASTVMVRDGAVAITCGYETKVPQYDRVTFILPAVQ